MRWVARVIRRVWKWMLECYVPQDRDQYEQ